MNMMGIEVGMSCSSCSTDFSFSCTFEILCVEKNDILDSIACSLEEVFLFALIIVYKTQSAIFTFGNTFNV